MFKFALLLAFAGSFALAANCSAGLAEPDENAGSQTCEQRPAEVRCQLAAESLCLQLPADRPITRAMPISNTYREAETITQQILDKELEIVISCQTAWRQNLAETNMSVWRRLFYQTFAQSLILAGYTLQTAVNYGYWRTPHKIPRYGNFSATFLRFIAKNEIAGGFGFERIHAGLKRKSAARRGADLKGTASSVENLTQQVDELLEARSRLVVCTGDASPAELALLSQEGALLADMRDQVVREYLQVHVRSVNKTFGQSAYDYLLIARRADGAYNANLMDMIREALNASGGKGLTSSTGALSRPPYLGLSRTGSLGTLISASMGVAIPCIVFVSTKMVAHRTGKKLQQRLSEPNSSAKTSPLKTEEYVRTIDQNAAIVSPLILEVSKNNADAWSQAQSSLSEISELTERERHGSNLRTLRLNSVQLFSAASEVVRGVMKIVRDWDSHYYNASNRDLMSARAAVVRIPSAATFVAAIFAEDIYEVVRHKKLTEKRALPIKLLEQRAKSLERLRNTIDGDMAKLAGGGP
jgi:hypothetical protein